MKKTRRDQIKEEALALELSVDPLQMRVLPIISKPLPLAAEAASHMHACDTHTHTNTQISWQQNREGAFFERVRGGRKRQKGDYNLIRSRKSWSNPAGGAEMPPCCMLLNYRQAGFHLNRLL